MAFPRPLNRASNAVGLLVCFADEKFVITADLRRGTYRYAPLLAQGQLGTLRTGYIPPEQLRVAQPWQPRKDTP